MRKKVIIIIASVVGAVLITGGVVGALYFINHGAPKPTTAKAAPFDPTKGHSNPDPTLQESQTKPDLSVDLGACSLVTQDAIQTALGIKVQPAENRGYGHEGGGDASQSCVYAFSADNNVANRLTITVTKFANQANATASAGDFSTSIKVSDVGNSAFFVSQPGDANLKQNQYTLYVFKDLMRYDFSILQPIPGDVFTASSAQAALVATTKTVTF